MVKDIKQIHDYHDFHKLKTAFTRSTYIIPLNYINFKPWTPNGFTLTTWIHIESCGGGGSVSAKQTNLSSENLDDKENDNVRRGKICALDKKVILNYLIKKKKIKIFYLH